MTERPILSARTQGAAGPLSLSADVVVVGSGAGGAMAAAELSQGGLAVLLLEEGGYHRPVDFNQREGDMLPLLFQDAGGRSTVDGAVVVLQGRGIGGSTVHNTNLCKRAPAEVLARWVEEHGAAGWSEGEMAPHYEAVERALNVHPMTEADVNRNNAILRRGVERLGWRGGLLSHNRRGCVRSGFCELGCAFDAKENALKILVPEAARHGAQVFADVHVSHVEWSGAEATGVRGHVVLPDGRPGRPVTARARAVCLSGSAVGSAALALRSGLPDPHGRAGAGLRLHPGLAVSGLFEEPVEGWRGVPQSYECTEKLSFAHGAKDRSWIVAAFAHPAGYASVVPGMGAAHAAVMRDYARTAVVAAMLHDETAGRVTVDRRGHPQVRYELTGDDAAALLRGAHACAEILLAAGAKQVMVPLAEPLVARSVAELAPLLRHRYRPLDPLLTAVHPMGTMALGADPRRAVVDPRGRHHHLRNVYVADGGLFPTSLGAPPQMSIYAAGRKVARAILEDLAGGRG
jgi:choline dehydrogenase-like flavoprotein